LIETVSPKKRNDCARALFVVTPGQSFAKFFDELSGLLSSVPPDPARVAEIFGPYGMEILAPHFA
jgi:hypothetical protein